MDLASIGLRIRELREAQEISLSELARRSKIGKGTLSELESGRRNPTLETLYAITTTLRVPLSSALTSPAKISGRAVEAILIERFEADSSVTETYRVRIRSETMQKSAAHSAGTKEHMIIFTGTAHVGPITNPTLIGPGMHHSWAADVPHLYQASTENVEALLIVRYPQ
ncbi:MAG: helix-turn-helix domain-containing protein [Corynebacteriales bacterium]|nr:helix-turn-helix domain-containing protein [Mycobacteriales bacterium]